MRLQPDWCDLRLVIEAAVSCLPDPDGRRVSVVCDAALPAVWADHDRLEQVFVNLLSNAVRHNPAGTRISVFAAPVTSPLGSALSSPGPDAAPTEVEIRVIDDGSGFPEHLARAPFESPRGQRSRSAGAGLGLSIARGIVQAHGGLIELSPVPAGTAFRIRLPVEAGHVSRAGGDLLDLAESDEMSGLLDGDDVVVGPMRRAADNA